MTARELVEIAGAHPWPLAAWLLVPPALVVVLRLTRGREAPDSAWRYVYSVLVYMVCAPGVLATLLTAYTLFFGGPSLLEANLLVYLLPIVSMVATLALIRQNIRFEDVPGFDRLSGLFVLLAATFLIVYGLSRTRVWIVFGGTLASLGLLAVALYGLLAYGARLLFRRPTQLP